jgi:integrase
MSDSQGCDTTIAAFTLDYQRHLADVDGMAPNSCDLHLRLVRRMLTLRFPSGEIRWAQLAFSNVADFLTREFARLPSYATQQTWLMIIRKLLRHLESNGLISKGWEGALPKRARKKHSTLPRYLSPEQTRALWNACRKERSHRHARDRALLSVFTQLALRAGEVARITLQDIDWQQGTVLIRSTKTHRERILPLSQKVGEASP